MESHRYRFSVVKMAKYLDVGICSYYNWRNCKYNKRQEKAEFIRNKIINSFEKSKCLYGSVRITADLNNTGTPISRPTVVKYMRIMGLRSVLTPKFRVRTTDSNHKNHIADNLLDREFKVLEPNKFWVSDITYIRTRSGFDYLTTIIDLFDRKVVGWSQSCDMTTINTVIPAFKMAIRRRRLSVTSAHGLMLHSDRGSQYTSTEFIKVLNRYGVIRSNSRKGNCWDNAVAESFFKTLKCELVYLVGLKTVEQIRDLVFEYIECWYNKKRRHKALNNLNIDEFWEKYNEKLNINKVA